MSESFDRAVEVCREITRWKVSPYKCLYHNPNKYSLVEFARWTQKYMNFKLYQILLDTAKITGFEPVPSELLNRHPARDGLTGRKVRVGKVLFYLIKPGEMSKTLALRYGEFKNVYQETNGAGK